MKKTLIKITRVIFFIFIFLWASFFVKREFFFKLVNTQVLASTYASTKKLTVKDDFGEVSNLIAVISTITPTRTPTPRPPTPTPTRTPTPRPPTPTPTRTPTPRPPTPTPTRTPTPTPVPGYPGDRPPPPPQVPTNTPPQVPTNTPTGDANSDGNIDDTDYTIWKCEFLGQGVCSNPSSNKTADFNNDGRVDLVDFEIWRRSGRG